MNVKEGSVLYVRPSANNLHTFTAAENSCFFDICLPNYTTLSHDRKITYFRDTFALCEGQIPTSDPDILTKKSVLTEIEYFTNVPTDIPGFGINDISYRGSM